MQFQLKLPFGLHWEVTFLEEQPTGRCNSYQPQEAPACNAEAYQARTAGLLEFVTSCSVGAPGAGERAMLMLRRPPGEPCHRSPGDGDRPPARL